MIATTSMTSPSSRSIDRPSSVLVLILAASITECLVNVLPSFVGALTDVLGFSAQRTGVLASADLVGIALASASAPAWLREVSWRRAALGSLSILLALNLACIGVTQFMPLLLLRLAAGFATGIAFCVALAGVLDTRRADRNTGLMVCMQVVVGALGVYALDAVRTAWRLDAVYLYIAAWLIPTVILVWRYFPDNPADRPDQGRIDWRVVAKPGAAAMLGGVLYWIMIGAVWGYLEGFARDAGLSLSQIGEALSLGLIVSLLGSFAAAWMGLRFGRAMPVLVSGVLQVGCLYLLTRLAHFSSPILAFYVLNTLFQIAWSYVVAYFIIIFNDVDVTGRFLALWGTACHASLAVGPYVGAFLIVDGHYTPLLRFGIAMAVGCYVAFLGAIWLTRRRVRAAAVGA